MTHRIFTSESVTEGHPDKMCDQISDAVLDAVLGAETPENLPYARVACETMLTTGLCIVAGEIRTEAWVDIPAIARQTIVDIGYDNGEYGFDGNACGVMLTIGEQSTDFGKSVDRPVDSARTATDDSQNSQKTGAGDQGLMFGYACSDTSEYMPMPIHLAHRLAQRLTLMRRRGTIPYLRPDGKTQVNVEYRNGRPFRVHTVLISTQHADRDDLNRAIKPDIAEHVIAPVLEEAAERDGLEIEGKCAPAVIVNPTGRFVKGGPAADTGVTGRKIIVDTYGGHARHGGGALSGKDPTKVDRSAAYMLRWAAKHVVAVGAAERCELQAAYVIGHEDPMSFWVDTFGTHSVEPERIEEAVRDIFPLTPGGIISSLRLADPDPAVRPVYRKTAAYGHFGRDDVSFPWERVDESSERYQALKSAFGLD